MLISYQCTCTTILIYDRLLAYFREIDSWKGESYTGGYKQNKRNGKGEYELADGSKEIAYFVDNRKKEQPSTMVKMEMNKTDFTKMIS